MAFLLGDDRCAGAVIDNSSRRPYPAIGEKNETRSHPRRSVVHLAGKVESADLGRHTAWRTPSNVSGFPPFDPDTGEIVDAPIERQTELVLEQLNFASRRRIVTGECAKCNGLLHVVEKFAAVKRNLCAHFPKKSSGADLHQCSGVAGAFRPSRSTASPRCCRRRAIFVMAGLDRV